MDDARSKRDQLLPTTLGALHRVDPRRDSRDVGESVTSCALDDHVDVGDRHGRDVLAESQSL